jgi:hypothetical protein
LCFGLDVVSAESVVLRYAGAVVPFKARPGVPTETIGGRKYVLSTDGGPLGDLDEPEYESPFGGKVIRGPVGNKWKYLWVYDTERQVLAMWRVTDGNEKVYEPAKSGVYHVLKLDKKGQLNRVTTADFRRVEAEMRRREDDTLDALKETIEAAKGEADRELDRLVNEYFKTEVRPFIERAISAVESGVIPIGFKPFGPAADGDEKAKHRQMVTHVMGQVLKDRFNDRKVKVHLLRKGFNFSSVDIQAVEWAIHDVQDKAFDEMLPPR